MNKNINDVTILIDTYGKLLTETKLNYLSLHYFDDLSLKEIATRFNVSRAAIHSSIISAIDELENYEKKLKFVKKQKIRIKLYNQLENDDIKKELLSIELSKEC